MTAGDVTQPSSDQPVAVISGPQSPGYAAGRGAGPREEAPRMTTLQRMALYQLASALRDATPPGSFDEQSFITHVAEAADD